MPRCKYKTSECKTCGTSFHPWTGGKGYSCSRKCKGRYMSPDEDRFTKRVHKTDSCWLWTGDRMTGGYGQFTPIGGRSMGAHR
jgi:hypothetical protein